MQLITGGGAFSRANINQINANFAEVASPDVWVRPQNGNNNNNGLTYATARATLAGCANLLRPGLVIGLEGVLLEEYTTPLGVNDVTIVGMGGSIPRQATTSGIPNGGGATWLSPATVTNTAALIRVQGQGWTLKNIYFNSSATSNGCIQPYTTGDPPAAADGAHLLIQNCILTGAAFGVYASGGTNYVRIYDSVLFGFSGSGDAAIAQTTGAGIGTLLNWEVLGCSFFGNATNIIVPPNKWIIGRRGRGNVFQAGTAAQINLTGGTAPNFVVDNVFNITAADFDPAGGVTGVTGDVWSNTLSDAIETGLPAN